jgi:hypothetical protein
MLPNHGRRTHKGQVTLRANFAGISLFSSLGSFHTITLVQIPRTAAFAFLPVPSLLSASLASTVS